MSKNRFLLLLAAIVPALGSAACRGPLRQDPPPQVRQPNRIEVNPPWATPESVIVPVPPGSPVSLKVEAKNEQKTLLAGDRTFAVFRRTDTGGTPLFFQAPLEWGQLARLSGAEIRVSVEHTFWFCDPALRTFLKDATTVDVRVQIERSDGEISFNPPGPTGSPFAATTAPIATDADFAARAEDPPFKTNVSIARPEKWLARCKGVVDLPTVDMPIPAARGVIVGRPKDASGSDCFSPSNTDPPRVPVNPPDMDPQSVNSGPGNTPVSLNVNYTTSGVWDIGNDACIHVFGVKGTVPTTATFTLTGDSFDRLRKSPGGTVRLDLVQKAPGPPPADFFSELKSAHLRLGIQVISKAPQRANEANTTNWSYSPKPDPNGKEQWFKMP